MLDVQTVISCKPDKAASIPANNAFVLPTVAVEEASYFDVAVASTATSPPARVRLTLSPISAVALFSSTTFKATEPAIATSPVPEPAVALAVITLVASVELSSASCERMPAVTDKPLAVRTAWSPIKARLLFLAIFKPTPPPTLTSEPPVEASPVEVISVFFKDETEILSEPPSTVTPLTISATASDSA